MHKGTTAPHISVIVPVYSCACCLPELYRRVQRAVGQITEEFELILVNDSSPDNAWDVICALCALDKRVKGLNLSRNFGQHYAISAALDRVTGEWTVVMDCDLQDQPEEILKLYRAAQSGYDIVFARRVNRRDSLYRRTLSRAFNWVLGILMGETLDPAIANFGIYSSQVIDGFRELRELNRSFPMFVRWLGFRRTVINVKHAERGTGRSSYTLCKLLRFALSNVIAYSNRPLIFSIYFGLLIAVIAFLIAIYFAARYLLQGIPVAGWTSLIVSLHFIAGLLFANLGLLGLYLGKIFDEVKKRPLYVVRESLNFEDLPRMI